MRDIGFRAKRLDNGAWVYGSGILTADDYCVIDTDTEMYVDEGYNWAGNTHIFRVAGAMCKKDSVCQNTGVQDCFGKDVYEGDIIKRVGIKRYGTVFYHKGSFYVGFPSNEVSLHTIVEEYDFMVVGNKFDHAKLLQGDNGENLNTLHLVLKHEWYDMIDSGDKPEEYRRICPHWIMHLMEYKNGLRISRKEADNYASDPGTFMLQDSSDVCFKDYDAVCFHRGYTDVKMSFMISDITTGVGNPEWGAPAEENVFIIKLDNRLD